MAAQPVLGTSELTSELDTQPPVTTKGEGWSLSQSSCAVHIEPQRARRCQQALPRTLLPRRCRCRSFLTRAPVPGRTARARDRTPPHSLLSTGGCMKIDPFGLSAEQVGSVPLRTFDCT